MSASGYAYGHKELGDESCTFLSRPLFVSTLFPIHRLSVSECELVGTWEDIGQGLGGFFNSVHHELLEHGFVNDWSYPEGFGDLRVHNLRGI